APATTGKDSRFLGLASVSSRVPVGKSNDPRPTLAGGLVPSGRHRKRPAIIRWKTRKTSPSISQTMRFPRRLRPRTLRPSAALNGGSTVRRSEGLTMRARSSGWPTMRGASASRYIVMSGSSGMPPLPTPLHPRGVAQVSVLQLRHVQIRGGHHIVGRHAAHALHELVPATVTAEVQLGTGQEVRLVRGGRVLLQVVEGVAVQEAAQLEIVDF